ncbi:MAG: hypothetical protein KIT84_06790 [Labilithrix sp.]|nr:hypothetical protein [Labilithrix sp.]MCW5810700.1 hypothetical protein [Labilithrix sp.]
MRVGLGLVLFAAPAFAAIAAVGCTANDEGADSASEVRVSPELSDLELASKASQLLSAEGSKCSTCHTAGKEDILRWGAAYKAVKDECLAPALPLTALERIDCLRQDKTDATSWFTAEKLGLYSGGAHLAEFEALFKAAYPEDEWELRFKEFKTAAGMPAFNRPGFTADEYALVAKWADRGLPKINEVMAPPGEAECVPSTTPELQAHIERMKTEGWGARLAAASTPMALCGAAENPVDCLTSLPDLTQQMGVEGTTQTLRELRKLEFRTSFWVRSSPDGRFAAVGGSPSKIIDLDAPATAAYVSVQAPYDPGFFPNNDGFTYAGAGGGGIRVCRSSVIHDAFASGQRITFNEPSCTRIIDTVYQSIGASVDGSLYFMATGAHTNDSGSSSGPLGASFGANATTTLTPMFNDGTKYVPGQNVQVKIPQEGDQQMSPTNTLLITRFGQKAGRAGFRIRSVTPRFGAPTGDAGASALPSVRVETKVLGTICLQGGKPQLSFDERFIAVHQYVDPNANPAGLPIGTANIFVHDLKTGRQVQLTKLRAGQKALFPHWRADGWLYFLVKDNTGKESLVASDVALRLSAE